MPGYREFEVLIGRAVHLLLLLQRLDVQRARSHIGPMPIPSPSASTASLGWRSRSPRRLSPLLYVFLPPPLRKACAGSCCAGSIRSRGYF